MTQDYTHEEMSPVRRLVGYVLRYRRAFLLGLLCTVVTQAVALASPKILQYAIDDLTRGVTRSKLFAYGSLLLGVGVVGGVFRFLMRKLLIGASRDIEYDMRNDFFAHLETLPAAYFQKHRTGDLMSRATNDLNAVRMMIGPSIMYSANTILTFVVALAMMIAIDARLTLLALIPLPFVSLSVKFFGSAIHRRFEQIQAQLSEVSAVAQEALAGVRVVRAYRQEDAELNRFRLSNAEYLRRNRGLIVLQGFFFPSMSFFLGLGALVVIWLGSRDVVRGRITLGEFVAFNAYLTMLSWPMIAFGWVTNMLQRGMASWKRMLEVFDTVNPQFAVSNPQSPTNPQSAIPNPQSIRNPQSAIRNGEIEFRSLTFGYGDRPVLRDVNAQILAGQTVALVGPTGSGKSTLISLLARLHEPPEGTVFIDGRDVCTLPLDVLRAAIGFVPQEPFLFSDTLGDNVAFGMDANEAGPAPSADRRDSPERLARIVDAGAVARLDKDVADFPKGYDTIVGERGLTLSGGQKQRTALARAIAVNPRILILDDALSAVDTYTEEEILTRLHDVMRARTSILVSHRISTVRRADRIFVLDDGRIVEQGTHDALVANGGVYAELHKKQLLEEELAAS
ncbi:MAG TPA: ABC transporter ATP-binding protein [Vicinamibacterales bacterium]|jgi:ATP-binding cassette subfamily B protein